MRSSGRPCRKFFEIIFVIILIALLSATEKTSFWLLLLVIVFVVVVLNEIIVKMCIRDSLKTVYPKARIQLRRSPLIPVSSSEIRRKSRAGLSIAEEVPGEVEAYILSLIHI